MTSYSFTVTYNTVDCAQKKVPVVPVITYVIGAIKRQAPFPDFLKLIKQRNNQYVN